MTKKSLILVFFLFKIGSQFAQTTDYAIEENWAALPTKMDNADWLPDSAILKNNQENAKADVFFVHPTTALLGFKGNQNLSNDNINESTDEGPIKYQASVFNGSCKVYAPRYQQAVLNNFFTRDELESKEAFQVAYKDVKAAFEYYMANYNQGRPIVIAGHSQGAFLIKQLLKEFFENKPLEKQLVAAYIIGFTVEKSYFTNLQPCADSTQNGCFVTYNTFGWNAKSEFADYKNSWCTNPLSWKIDDEYAKSELHLGGINKKIDGIAPNLTGCKCEEGKLFIQNPDVKGFMPIAGKNYHIHDYQLFYMNLRQNVADRLNHFLSNYK